MVLGFACWLMDFNTRLGNLLQRHVGAAYHLEIYQESGAGGVGLLAGFFNRSSLGKLLLKNAPNKTTQPPLSVAPTIWQTLGDPEENVVLILDLGLSRSNYRRLIAHYRRRGHNYTVLTGLA